MSKRRSCCLLISPALLPAAALLWPVAATAAEWNLSAEGKANVIAQDRADAGFRTLVELQPSLGITGTGRGLQGSLNYSLSHLQDISPKQGQDSLHNLDASVQSEIVDGFFFIDATAQAGLVAADSAVGFVDNVNRGSRADQGYSVGISPRFKGRIGRHARVEFANALDYRGTSRGNGEAWSIGNELSLKSGTASALYQWTFDASHQLTYFSDRTETGKHLSASGTVRVNRAFSGRATARYDDSDVQTTRSSRDIYAFEPEVVWQPNSRLQASLGVSLSTDDQGDGLPLIGSVNWTPSPRTDASLTVGRRFFGTSVSGSFSHFSRHTRSSVTVTREFANTQRGTLQPIITPLLDDSGVQQTDPASGEPLFTFDTIVRDTSENFVNTELSGSHSIQGVRSTVTLGASVAERQFEQSGGDEQSVQFDLRFSRRFREGLTGAVTAHVRDARTNLGTDGRTLGGTLELGKQIGRKTRVVASYLGQVAEGNNPDDDTEHRLTVGISTRLR